MELTARLAALSGGCGGVGRATGGAGVGPLPEAEQLVAAHRQQLVVVAGHGHGDDAVLVLRQRRQRQPTRRARLLAPQLHAAVGAESLRLRVLIKHERNTNTKFCFFIRDSLTVDSVPFLFSVWHTKPQYQRCSFLVLLFH